MDKDRREEVVPNLKYGLGIVDVTTKDKNGDAAIVHAVFYLQEPTEDDKNRLAEEISNDESFGLSDKIDDLIIVDLPDYMVAYMLKEVSAGDVEMEEHNGHE